MNRQAGFTWIELLVVVAVMAILALMAIPSMQEGTLRKQVKDGIALADFVKSGVQVAWGLAGEMPADNKAAGLAEADKILGSLVNALRGGNLAVTGTFGNHPSKAL